MDRPRFQAPEHAQLLEEAFESFRDSLSSLGGSAQAEVLAWVDDAFNGDPVGSMLHPRSYPVLWMPRWADKSSWTERTKEFHRSIAFSTIHGYMFIRFIDNIVDGDAPAPLAALPAVGAFHTGFLRPYQEFFEFDHPLWDLLDSTWTSALGASIADAGLESIGSDEFEEVSARKTAGALVPIAAACYLSSDEDKIPAWREFVTRFSRWHQFHTDLLHWEKDRKHENVTYLQSTFASSSGGQSMARWLLEDGLRWATDLADRFLAEAAIVAARLESDEVGEYLQYRAADAAESYRALRPVVRRAALTDDLVAEFIQATSDPQV